jgi:exodeoxyribonuclease III
MSLKIISWNVNGIRAISGKGLDSILSNFNADVICFQETKAQDDQVRSVIGMLDNYELFINSAEQKGYSGTAILTKIKPIKVQYGINMEEHDNEGRVITLFFEKFILVTVYVPNSGSELARLTYRSKWDNDFTEYLSQLQTQKPVVLCGDLNVAHQPIDLANPKSNYNKTSGYTQIEIDGMSNLLSKGFVDTFRHFYPSEIKYSWWSYRFNSRAKNIGWRIDYFLCSKAIKNNLKESFILNEIVGSDHCPVGISLEI